VDADAFPLFTLTPGMSRDPLAAFDDEIIAATSADSDIGKNVLRAIASAHQNGVRDLPGVDDIVYEWRNQFHQDPIVHRTETVYVLAVQSHVWEEFGDALDISAAELDCLKALHDRQARTLVSDTSRFDSDDAVVLTRP
jgi:hypothetical protein